MSKPIRSLTGKKRTRTPDESRSRCVALEGFLQGMLSIKEHLLRTSGEVNAVCRLRSEEEAGLAGRRAKDLCRF